MALSKTIIKKIAFSATLALVVAGLILGGFAFGYQRGEQVGTSQVQINVANTDGSGTTDADFSVFWEAWQRLKRFHVDAGKLTDQKLVYGAIRGITNAFGDPHTNFFEPADAQKFEEDINGNFGGIGAEIGILNEQLAITSPLKGTPSQAAGLKSGDVIVKINDEPTQGLDVSEAVKKIRGPVGTKVVLNIFREGWLQAKDITITRALITIPTLDLTLHNNNQIAQIQLYSFNENAPLQFFKAVYGLLNSHVKGVVIDLRNNPGGYLEVASNLAGYFVDRGTVVVSERFREGSDKVLRADGNASLKNIPVVVLINRGSASASEILAGALRDLRGAKIIGERSFGKGTVQEINELKDGSTIKITVAHWVMPKGLILDKNGIKPDYEVALTDEDIKAKRDPQLAKALQVLQEEIAKNPNGSVTEPTTIPSFGGVTGQEIKIVPAPTSTKQ